MEPVNLLTREGLQDMNPVERAVRLAMKPMDNREPWRWAEENYFPPVSSLAGRWRSDNSPWVRKIMEDFADNRVRQITALCSAQSAKTETMLALCNWIVDQDPSPTMWVAASDEEGLKFANERLMPSFRMCPPVAKQIPPSRTLAKSMEVMFPTMMFEIVGANSRAKLQSRTRRFLLLDEVRNWPDWALPMVKMRSRTWWNSRTVILTTPGVEHDTVHQEFLEGSQDHYHVPCLSCGKKAPLVWENMQAEHPETHCCVRWGDIPGARSQQGKWHFEALAPHIRYVCPSCGHMHSDHPRTRFRIAAEGEWVSHNPTAPRHLRSYTWNALLPTWVKWKDLVIAFLQAHSALEFGNYRPLEAFYTESLGLPWNDELKYTRTDGYLMEREVDYDPAKPWDREVRRFMMVDVQAKGGRHFYYIIRAFAKGGDSRLLHFGIAWSIEELRAIQETWKVKGVDVGIDSGAFTSEVYGYIMEGGTTPRGDYAWKAMKGDRAAYYMSPANTRVPWTRTQVDPYVGTPRQGSAIPITQILYSKSSLLDALETFMRGGKLVKWEIPKNADGLHEYKLQVTAYERQTKTAKGTGVVSYDWIQKRADDHYGSCERECLAAAFASGLLDEPSAAT